VARRLVTGRDEEEEEEVELVLGKVIAVDVGLDEPRREVVAGLEKGRGA
jgi:hypothetical protein